MRTVCSCPQAAPSHQQALLVVVEFILKAHLPLGLAADDSAPCKHLIVRDQARSGAWQCFGRDNPRGARLASHETQKRVRETAELTAEVRDHSSDM